MTTSRRIVLGVSASIAIHRALDLCSELKKKGHRVHVVMTPSATRLIAPMTFQAFSHEKVHHEMWEPVDSFDHDHIRLAQEGDIFALVPATADTIGKLANGIMDNVLLTTAFAFAGPKLFAPAMNWRMWEHPAVQRNAAALQAEGWTMVGPVAGELACGEQGSGRLAPVLDILRALEAALEG